MDALVTGKPKKKLPESIGFREGTMSVHTSRTMMLSDLSIVLDLVPEMARVDDYSNAIIGRNILGKPTQTTRRRTARRLIELYALDRSRPIFRVLRKFWTVDTAGRPMLAYLTAAARDPILRGLTEFIIANPNGEVVSPARIADQLAESHPRRFQTSTGLATAQRLASSWTQAGFLSGKTNKRRTRPIVTPTVATFALVLGHLSGRRGKLILDTPWTRMLDRTRPELDALIVEASRQGWLNSKSSGSVVDITFPGLLTPQDEKASHDSD